MYTLLLGTVHSQGNSTITVASSGLTALLMPDGCTAHSHILGFAFQLMVPQIASESSANLYCDSMLLLTICTCMQLLPIKQLCNVRVTHLLIGIMLMQHQGNWDGAPRLISYVISRILLIQHYSISHLVARRIRQSDDVVVITAVIMQWCEE